MQNGLSGLVPHAELAPSRCIEVVRRGAGEIAECVTAGATIEVLRYPGWSLADLAVHTGTIYRWVEQIVRDCLLEPPETEDPIPDRTDLSALLAWFEEGAELLTAALESVDPGDPVWTFASDATARFWLRRMALETATHAWDAAGALFVHSARERPCFDDDVALVGLDESLALHLPSTDDGIAGSGETVACGSPEREDLRFVFVLEADRVRATADDGTVTADAVVRASIVDLWLLIIGRDFWSHYDIEGAPSAFKALKSAFGRAPVPDRP